MQTRSWGVLSLIMALSLAVSAEEPTAHERLADQIIAFLKHEKAEGSTKRMLAGALPGLVTEKHLPDLELLLSQVGAERRITRQGLTQAIAASNAPKAGEALLRLVDLREDLRLVTQCLRDVGAAAPAIKELHRLLPQASDERQTSMIVGALLTLDDDSELTRNAIASVQDVRTRASLYARMRSAAVVPPLIALLDDPAARSYSRTILDALARLTLQTSPKSKAQWQAWWEASKDDFRLLGAAEEDVPALIEMLLDGKHSRLQSELSERLRRWPAATIQGLLPYLASENYQAGARAALLLWGSLGQAGKAALADYVLAGKPVQRAATENAGAALAARAQTIEQVAEFLERPDIPEPVKCSFIGTVARERQSSKDLDFYRARMPSLSSPLRVRLLKGILQAGNLEAVKLAFDAVESGDSHVCSVAYSAAMSRRFTDPAVLDFCLRTLQEPDVSERRIGLLLRVVASYGTKPEVQALAMKFVESDSRVAKEGAINLLRRTALPENVAAIAALAVREPNRYLRGQLVNCLYSVRTEEGLAALETVAELDDPSVRSAVASALLGFNRGDLRPRVIQLALKVLPTTRGYTARQLLSWLGRAAPRELAPRLIEQLEANPEMLASDAIAAFQYAEREEAGPRLKQSLTHADPHVRFGAAVSLLLLGDRAGAEEYRKALSSEDLGIRRAAVDRSRALRHKALAPYLIERLAKERDPHLKGLLVSALRSATGRAFGRDLAKWQEWLASQDGPKE